MTKIFYSTPTNTSGVCSAKFLAPDWDAGKWYEAWWGLIMVLDLTQENDGMRWVIKSNWLSWTDVKVHIDFSKHKQPVNFDIRVYYNPFNLLTQAWIASGLRCALTPMNAYLKPHGASIERAS